MSGAERSVIVLDYDLSGLAPGSEPSGRALVRAAAAAGADRVAVDVRATADGWVVVSPTARVRAREGEEDLGLLTLAETRGVRCADGRLSTLEEVLLEAHRKRIGLVVRVHDTLVLRSLGAALGVTGGEGPAALRSRFLVVVRDARVGKRLRLEARDLPSARHVPAPRPGAAGLREKLRARFPNFARAAADADDLLIDAAIASPARVRDELVPTLRRRGAYVWVAGVPTERRTEYEELGAGGLLVRTAPPPRW